jgi:rare lipoprotein A (peptidoglycan hydrolase)
MARVVPLSKKAHNRLTNVMEGNAQVRMEQRVGTKVFLVSANGKWCAWVELSGDPNWDIVL